MVTKDLTQPTSQPLMSETSLRIDSARSSLAPTRNTANLHAIATSYTTYHHPRGRDGPDCRGDCLRANDRRRRAKRDVFRGDPLAPGELTTGMQWLDDGGEGVTFPDTTLGFFSDATFSNLIDFDDDGGGIVGDGFGSGLFEYDVLPDGSVPLVVSGWPDYDFDGLDDEEGTPHEQEGNVDLILLIWEIDDVFTLYDRQEVPGSLSPGATFSHVFQDASWIGHQFTAMADNTVDGGNDVDFWRFTGLEPGATFEAETSSTWLEQDTILGWFDDTSGELIESNDDIDPATDFLSRLSGSVPASGEVVLAVTSYDDF